MNCVVEEPTRNAGRPPDEETESCPYGEVEPIPTNPLLPETIRNGVVVPWSATTNIGVLAPTNPCTDSTERSPHGEEVPTETVEVEVKEPVKSDPENVEDPNEINPLFNCSVVEVAE
jgi:hypothetical protein